MTEMSRLWPAESQGPYAWWSHTAHDNAQGRAPSPDPLPCAEGSGCSRQAKVGAGTLVDSELSALPRTPHRCGEM